MELLFAPRYKKPSDDPELPDLDSLNKYYQFLSRAMGILNEDRYIREVECEAGKLKEPLDVVVQGFSTLNEIKIYPETENLRGRCLGVFQKNLDGKSPWIREVHIHQDKLVLCVDDLTDIKDWGMDPRRKDIYYTLYYNPLSDE